MPVVVRAVVQLPSLDQLPLPAAPLHDEIVPAASDAGARVAKPAVMIMTTVRLERGLRRNDERRRRKDGSRSILRTDTCWWDWWEQSGRGIGGHDSCNASSQARARLRYQSNSRGQAGLIADERHVKQNFCEGQRKRFAKSAISPWAACRPMQTSGRFGVAIPQDTDVAKLRRPFRQA